MKKLYVLLLVAAFLLVGAQAFASPPIGPPVEGFVITSTIDALVDGAMTVSERYNWTYFEGWGKGPLFPAGYTPAGCAARCDRSDDCAGLYSELGFTGGAQIAYEQTLTAKGAIQTRFFFDAYSNPDAAALQDNLVVHKEINYQANDPLKDQATHSEKVGLSVVSMGAKNADATSLATGLLSLCPWLASTPGTGGGAYPPTNEGIAAGSSFKVSNITAFISDSRVNSTDNPMLSYNVDGPSGTGFIDAGFVVELYEGPAGTTWAPVAATAYCATCVPAGCDPRAGTMCYKDAPTPPLASRTSYKEYASADGTWSFSKHVKYESKMPAGASAGTFPINQVLVP
jgi:hypothetical protein